MINSENMGMIGHRGSGLVPDAIPQATPVNGHSPMDGWGSPHIALGHTRYSTSGHDGSMQPIDGKIGLAHNGNSPFMDMTADHFGVDISGAGSDSHAKHMIITAEAERNGGDVVAAMHTVLPRIEGAYCLVVSDGKRLVAAQDPQGIHPMALGKLTSPPGFVVASERPALIAAGAEFVRDIQRGEILVIDEQGPHSSIMDRREEQASCMMEFAYIMDETNIALETSVALARRAMGAELWREHPVEADIVVGVPESGISAAMGYAKASGIDYEIVFKRNPYIGRTFMSKGDQRTFMLQQKMSVLSDFVRGKRIVVVDDSMVKGNSMTNYLGMLHDAGAAEVHARFAAPAHKYACLMGLDTSDTSELIARHNTIPEMQAKIRADSIGFLSHAGILRAVQSARLDLTKPSKVERMCTACTTGDYPIQIPASRAVELGIPTVRRAMAR